MRPLMQLCTTTLVQKSFLHPILQYFPQGGFPSIRSGQAFTSWYVLVFCSRHIALTHDFPAAFRFFRICLKLNNRNLTAHLIKHDLVKPLIDLTVQESRRDNLLSSSCQEFFEHLRRVSTFSYWYMYGLTYLQENIKDFINHCMMKHEKELRLLAETALGGPRFMSFIRRWEMNNEPPPKEEKVEKYAPCCSRLCSPEL